MFVIVVISLLDFFIGDLLPPNDYQKSRGFVGWNITVFNDNLFPHFRETGFFAVFSVYTSGIAGDFTGSAMTANLLNRKPITVEPVYNELGYNEYPRHNEPYLMYQFLRFL